MNNTNINCYNGGLPKTCIKEFRVKMFLLVNKPHTGEPKSWKKISDGVTLRNTIKELAGITLSAMHIDKVNKLGMCRITDNAWLVKDDYDDGQTGDDDDYH